jgi:molybdopterin molybdotransferase
LEAPIYFCGRNLDVARKASSRPLPSTIHGMSGELLSYSEANAIVVSFARGLSGTNLATERVGLADASGRVLAAPILADQDQPAFARSTRDGFACRAAEIATHEVLPIAGSTHAGEAPAGPLPAGVAWEIMTGAPVPAGADAVVMIEHVERNGERVRLLPKRSIAVQDNVVGKGAQAHQGDALVSAGTVVGLAQIALAAACGYARLSVYKRPRVAILTTGDELVPIEQETGPGQIRNSNAPMLATLVTAAGGEAQVLPIAADTAESLDAALRHAMDADLLLISGGVSAGKFDLVEPALARMGATFHFTGVRIQPGKPLVFGEVARAGRLSLPFFGLPGNPISSAATFLLFAAPVLAALGGAKEVEPRFAAAQLARATDRNAKAGLTRFLPGFCEFNAPGYGLPQVATVPWHGSGDLPAFARSNCFIVVPGDVSSLDSGAMVRILML